MTDKDHDHQHPVHHAPAPSDAPDHHMAKGSGRRRWGRARRGLVRFTQHRYMRRLFWATTVTVAVTTVVVLGLWWRLSSGPIELDIVTPWLKAAIEENFGGRH